MSAQPSEAKLFQFEADFVESLRCIPMVVRYKLDTCGIKLKLVQWNQFTQGERQQLVELPCTTASEIEAYRTLLQNWVLQKTGVPVGELPVGDQPDWLNATVIPATVLEKAQAEGLTLYITQWRSLTPLQRFVLIKLSRPSHENKNFVPALQEFQLV